MKCKHCQYKVGHYSNIEYRTIENKLMYQNYWFCHTCAFKVYDDEKNFIPEAKS